MVYLIYFWKIENAFKCNNKKPAENLLPIITDAHEIYVCNILYNVYFPNENTWWKWINVMSVKEQIVPFSWPTKCLFYRAATIWKTLTDRRPPQKRKMSHYHDDQTKILSPETISGKTCTHTFSSNCRPCGTFGDNGNLIPLTFCRYVNPERTKQFSPLWLTQFQSERERPRLCRISIRHNLGPSSLTYM